jgi:signal transduction histidine kinase
VTDLSAVGDLFAVTPDAVLVYAGRRLVEANAPARRLLGLPDGELDPGAGPRGEALAQLLGLDAQAPLTRLALAPYGHVDALRRTLPGRDVVLLRDVTAEVRRVEGLRRVSALSRGLLGDQVGVAPLLQAVCGEARALTGAAYSAVVVLREGSRNETRHFFYDAPRREFPASLPRVGGLLQVPLDERRSVRLDDVRPHLTIGLPKVHPPLGALLAVPLLAGDAALGEIAVAKAPEGGSFDEVDQVLLEELAAHTSVGLRWAEEAERGRERAALRQQVVDTARHDIRTPIGAGKGFAQLLLSRMGGMKPEQVQIALAGIEESFTRIEAFATRLLLDDRALTPGVGPQWAVVDVRALLEAVRRDACAAAGSDDAVVLHLDGAPPTLAGDPEMVRQVIDNLVGNALKHAGGAVVTARSEGDQVRVDVRDDGPGIPEHEQGRLFEQWTRAPGTRAQGFGLGLAIVKRLVVAHGGLLGVSSRPGEGSTFWVTFPRARPGA